VRTSVPPVPREVYEARLAHQGLARTAVSVEELEAQGYVAGEPDPRYGSVWCVRRIDDEATRP